MKQQVTDFLDTNSLCDPLQSGFRSGHGTSSARLKVVEYIRRNMDIGNITIMVLLDFSCAFDTIGFDLLCTKLSISY